MRLFNSQLFLNKKGEDGFTLMEIIVATTIFVVTVSGILVLFNYVLKINREVQVSRTATQNVRNFTETLIREIRSGQIYYGNIGTDCTGNYSSGTNKTLGMITADGDQLCFSIRGKGDMNLEKITSSGSIQQTVNSTKMRILSPTFRFKVFPVNDPKVDQGGGTYPGIQPMVTIIAEFEVDDGQNVVLIPYQTSISTDLYDIPNQ